jgi:hypothetical protein
MYTSVPAYYTAPTRPGMPTWSNHMAPTVLRMLDTGANYADRGQYIGYATGCIAGGAMASPTIFAIAVGCAAGMEVGGGVGYVVGGGVGLVVGLF